MWFKQVSIFQFSKPFTFSADSLNGLLAPLSFTPCLPSFASSIGWIAPISESQTQLVYSTKRFLLICLQFEEKILPATVVRQAVAEKISEIESKEARAVRAKEKQTIKDEMMQTLLPRAFSKKSQVMGYIDLEKQQLIVNSNQPVKVERFIAFFKRAIAPVDIHSVDVKKSTELMTEWLSSGKAPLHFDIGQACALRDRQQERRIIRCQHQDLLAQNIQSFLKEECEVLQLALTWKDNVKFTLAGDFSLKNIQFQEAVLALAQSDYTETKEQRFDADFVLMTEILSQLIDDLLHACAEKQAIAETV